MGWTGIRKALMVVLSGGMLLQTTASCQETLGPVISEVASSLILNILLSGIGT